MTQLLSKWTTPKVILSLFVLNLFFSFFLFPKYGNELNRIAGEKVQILDKHPTYTKAQVTELFTKIKEEGRTIHRFVTSVIDMIYPFVYAPFLVLLMIFFAQKVIGPSPGFIRFSIGLGLFLMLTDYYENFTILQLLNDFPNLDDDLVFRGSKLTNLKFVLVLLAGGIAFLSSLGWMAITLLKMTFGRDK